ncbi:hypothetical protein HYV50_06040 [Candidatus Pacearchaeota archaeon]|nr:hypothetical protein [Candidatus Pacearchaeota archaeon]
MTERITADITSKINGNILVFSQDELNITGRVEHGNSVVIRYEGNRRLAFGKSIYIRTADGPVHEAVIGHHGSKGKVYATVIR